MSDLNATRNFSATSTVNLVRTSHVWTQAHSAAGIVLRYVGPMRRQLTATLGSADLADNALRLLLAHLVSAGFGEHKRGRLRDYLVRAIRSAAKTSLQDLPESDQLKIDLGDLTVESKAWLGYWRDGLLERAWRSLERIQHAHKDEPLFAILQHSTSKAPTDLSELTAQIESEFGVSLSHAQIQEMLAKARTLFAQLIADEVAETMEAPTSDEVKREIGQLGLGKAFNGIQH